MSAPRAAHWLSPDPDALLQECFQQASRHPFYRDVLRGVRDAFQAPAMDKHALRDALSGYQPGADPGGGVYLVRSAGSSQTPLIFPVDIAENHAQRQALAHCLLDAGMFDARSVALNLFGYASLYRSAAIMDDMLERCRATTLAMSAQAEDSEIQAIAGHFQPSHIMGTPSRLAAFASHLEKRGVALDIPQLLYGGELMRSSTMERLRAALGTRQAWSLYGGAETGIWAWGDASARPGLFEIIPQVVVEILDADRDGYGRIAVSNGWRRRFPVFRYCLGDIGRLTERQGVRYLELRGRDSRSFRFNELNFELETFERLAAAAEAFQLQLSFDAAGRDRLTLLLVDEAKRCRPDGIRAALAAMLNQPENPGAFELRMASREQLRLDPATSKAPPLLDLRR
ncbi:AMP-binding protein [Chromobacterium alticapitis]|uniref:CoF synthetase n=1 Tax=Chromobacterium alticapitis TaxID=2073169 RepID=A0A2S5DFS9_9NEIS|nr:AMP-binding protein [Chromobacterium alticapitis]POZ61963.1 hypothetical protein C2I19_11290 [Chromobacterium alticapitis]